MAEEHKCLVEKHIAKDIWDMSMLQTSNGVTFFDCIRSAVNNPKCNVGLYMGDSESYDLFKSFVHPVIADYHKVDIENLKSVHDLGDANNLEDLSTEYQEKIISTRVRVGRTVKGYPMQGKLSREVILQFNYNNSKKCYSLYIFFYAFFFIETY